MHYRRRQVRGRGPGAILAIQRLSEPVRRAHSNGSGRLRDDSWRVNPNHRIVPGSVASPFDNVIRFGEAVELRQTQRAAVPLQRGEAARLALPTGFKSEEAQLESYRNTRDNITYPIRVAMGERPRRRTSTSSHESNC